MTIAYLRAERQGARPAAVTNTMQGAIRALVAWIVAALARRRTRRALELLDEAGLKDIGLVRSNIYGVDRDPRYSHLYPGR